MRQADNFCQEKVVTDGLLSLPEPAPPNACIQMIQEAISKDYIFDLEAARKLPELIRFGTSTWTYPGWKGLVYKNQYKSDRQFKSESLIEYARLGLFRTVGIDSTFYKPASQELLSKYASQVEENFQWVSKVWERITLPRYPDHPRYGKFKGQTNPDFLNADLFESEVLEPCRVEEIHAHCGPFVFQFGTIHHSTMTSGIFFEKLARFLGRLPKDFRYAVEMRNPEYLCKEYFDTLNQSRNITHCFNHWNYMPPLKKQMLAAANAGGLNSDFFCARILTPSGVNYQQAVTMFQPYDQLKRVNEEMRADVCTLLRRALTRGNQAFVIVNNRAEGCSPISIDQLTKMLVNSL